jgi:hypothetical protein
MKSRDFPIVSAFLCQEAVASFTNQIDFFRRLFAKMNPLNQL